MKDTHFYVSNDKEHDTLFMQHCLLMHWDWLSSQGIKPTHHWVWNDGCVGQFKGCQTMYFVARHPSLINGCFMTWNFFGTKHGKGEWDCAKVVVKQTLKNEQIHNPKRRI